jgi:hypothetical protein
VPAGLAVPHHSEAAEDEEATAKKGEGSRLRDRLRDRQEAVEDAARPYKNPGDLSRVIDPVGPCIGCAGEVDLGEAAAGI